LYKQGYKSFRIVDLINIYEYIKDITHYTSTHAEQEYNILLFIGILSDINKHLCYAAQLDSLATQEG